MTDNDEPENRLIAERRAKLARLRETGSAYPNDFRRDSLAAELLAAYRGGRFLSPTPPSGPIAANTMDDLPRIAVPTLFLIGDKDVPFFQIVARALAYYVPKARLAVVAGGGHMVNLIEPDRYNATITGFLAGVIPPGARR